MWARQKFHKTRQMILPPQKRSHLTDSFLNSPWLDVEIEGYTLAERLRGALNQTPFIKIFREESSNLWTENIIVDCQLENQNTEQDYVKHLAHQNSELSEISDQIEENIPIESSEQVKQDNRVY